MSLTLQKNIEKLNQYYAKQPFIFINKGDYIHVQEQKPYFFSSAPKIKSKLKYIYKMRFGKGKIWYIGKDGMEYLSQKLLKFQPSKGFKTMKKELKSYLDQISNQSLLKTLLKIFEKNKSFFTHPGSIQRHHSYKHGLFEHSLQVVDLAMASFNLLSDQEDQNLKDLIIAGGLIHDIGKAHSYVIESDGTYSPTKVLLKQDHIIHGPTLLERHADPQLDSSLKNDLIHIIASHHTLKEWGSPIEPKTDAAWMIATADNLSSKVGG